MRTCCAKWRISIGDTRYVFVYKHVHIWTNGKWKNTKVEYIFRLDSDQMSPICYFISGVKFMLQKEMAPDMLKFGKFEDIFPFSKFEISTINSFDAQISFDFWFDCQNVGCDGRDLIWLDSLIYAIWFFWNKNSLNLHVPHCAIKFLLNLLIWI